MNNDIVAVDVSKMSIYAFQEEGETEQKLLDRANQSKQREVDTWKENKEKYPCEKFEKCYNKALKREYKTMTYGEFKELKRKHYINQPIKEITEELYYERLNALPPLKYRQRSDISMFSLSEYYTGTYTDQYAKVTTDQGTKYYTKIVDFTDEGTWIDKYLDLKS